MTGLNTDQFNPTAPSGNVNGTSVWLSTTPGGLTTTVPSDPNHAVFIGTIIRTHQNQGIIEVKIQNGYELNELHNVSVGSVTAGQFLYYNGTSQLWEPEPQLFSNGTNIGIGTSTPSYQYHQVGGKLYLESDDSSFGQLQIYDPEDAEAAISFQNKWIIGAGSYGVGTDTLCIGSLDAYGGTLFIGNNGNVGIHTATPSANLDVQGSFNVYSDPVNGESSSITCSTANGITLSTFGDTQHINILSSTEGVGTINIGTSQGDTTNLRSTFTNINGWAFDGDTVTNTNGVLISTELVSNVLIAVNDYNSGINSDLTIGDYTRLLHVNWNIDQSGNANFNGSINGNSLGSGSLNGLFVTDNSPSNITVDSGPYGLVLASDGAIDISSAVSNQINLNSNVTFTSYTETVIANGNSGTSKTLSLASGTVHTCTLTGNCTFTMPTATAGKSFSLFLNTGSGGYTATFTGVRWADSATPTATITASKVDIYSFISDGTYWYGSFSQNYG